ncbi:CHASE2 domain-containing sensor protein [Pseudarthrobacter defluvii]|uniref:hypothetical protein n=1 Tax=Pseudarthrobacter defluvii TaxID=410837 RepID=UPI00278AED54|nr:hypothetical protein [Pseudarthrobacter defluvii]MDQ0769436.1 CHASE2 domain-containing sensor protein [Pseudarthrobacter defluvii]
MKDGDSMVQAAGIQLWFGLAGGSFLASCTLGLGTALSWFDTAGFRWLHHALFVLTCVLAAVGAGSLLWSASPAGWFLLPAALPLAALPALGSSSLIRHAAIAVTATPFFLISVLVASR